MLDMLALATLVTEYASYIIMQAAYHFEDLYRTFLWIYYRFALTAFCEYCML